MGWQHYCLIFRLKSPLHIGYRQVGNLMQTRPCVPGRVLWGALTARLVRDYDDGANGQRYAEVGEAVRENFRFGYLWPAIPKGSEPIEKKESPSLDDLEVRFPWDEKEPPFDYLFLDAYASTALEYDRHVAGEGMLHQIEFIRPYTRTIPGKDPKPVYLVGDIFIKDNFSFEGNILKNWSEVLHNLQLGADRTYGWGRVELIKCNSESLSLLEKEGFKINEGKELSIETTNSLPETFSLAHVLCNKNPLDGQIEVLTGYETNPQTGRPRLISDPPVAYVPGTKIREKKTFTFSREYPGLWEMITN